MNWGNAIMSLRSLKYVHLWPTGLQVWAGADGEICLVERSHRTLTQLHMGLWCPNACNLPLV